jgi:hypothetical protein
MKKLLVLLIVFGLISCKQKKYPYKIQGIIDGQESILFTDTYDIYNDTIFVTCSNGYVFKVSKPFKIEMLDVKDKDQ